MPLGLNLFEKLPRKVHATLLILGGVVSLNTAFWYFLFRDHGGIFGLIDINNLQAVAPWVPDWLVNMHRSPFMLWFHIVLLTLLGLGVIWEGIKYWKTGR